jgi:hypothetical protein
MDYTINVKIESKMSSAVLMRLLLRRVTDFAQELERGELVAHDGDGVEISVSPPIVIDNEPQIVYRSETKDDGRRFSSETD